MVKKIDESFAVVWVVLYHQYHLYHHIFIVDQIIFIEEKGIFSHSRVINYNCIKLRYPLIFAKELIIVLKFSMAII